MLDTLLLRPSLHFTTLHTTALNSTYIYNIFVKLQFGSHPVAVVQYTFTHKQYTEQHKNFIRVRTVPHLCGFYPGICLTTEEKARKNLSQGSRRVPVRTMNILGARRWLDRFTIWTLYMWWKAGGGCVCWGG